MKSLSVVGAGETQLTQPLPFGLVGAHYFTSWCLCWKANMPLNHRGITRGLRS